MLKFLSDKEPKHKFFEDFPYYCFFIRLYEKNFEDFPQKNGNPPKNSPFGCVWD